MPAKKLALYPRLDWNDRSYGTSEVAHARLRDLGNSFPQRPLKNRISSEVLVVVVEKDRDRVRGSDRASLKR